MIQQSAFVSQSSVEFGIRLSDVSERDKIWDNYRVQSLVIELIYGKEREFYRLSKRIENCSCYLKFEIDSNSSLVLKKANFCRVRYCYVCLWRKSLYHRATLYKAYEKIKPKCVNYHFIFLTLTIRNCRVEELRNTLDYMNKSWHRLVKRKQFINTVVGWVRSTEITRDSEQLNTHAHPHFHVVLVVKPGYFGKSYIKQEEWARIWRECLRVDYTPVVDIRSIKSRRVNDDAVKSAIMETLKYSIKQADINIDISNLESREWFYILTRQTRKLRFIATGGLFKDAIKNDDEIDNDDLVKIGNDEVKRSDKKLFNFTFCRTKRFYRYDPYFNE